MNVHNPHALELALMKMAEPRRKILARAAANLAELDRRVFSLVTGIGDSPIERLFYEALDIEIRTNWEYDLKLVVAESGTRSPEFLPELDSVAPFKILLESQIEVEGARVDFLATTMAGKFGLYKSLIIECDGHDYHERTKEQASRDRARDRKFQNAGHTIYRFTGAEIYADPIKCANQVIRWALDTIHPPIDGG